MYFRSQLGTLLPEPERNWRNKCGIKDYRLDSRGRRCSSFSHRSDDKAKGTRGRNIRIRPGPYYPWDSGHDEADNRTALLTLEIGLGHPVRFVLACAVQRLTAVDYVFEYPSGLTASQSQSLKAKRRVAQSEPAVTGFLRVAYLPYIT